MIHVRKRSRVCVKRWNKVGLLFLQKFLLRFSLWEHFSKTPDQANRIHFFWLKRLNEWFSEITLMWFRAVDYATEAVTFLEAVTWAFLYFFLIRFPLVALYGSVERTICLPKNEENKPICWKCKSFRPALIDCLLKARDEKIQRMRSGARWTVKPLGTIQPYSMLFNCVRQCGTLDHLKLNFIIASHEILGRKCFAIRRSPFRLSLSICSWSAMS